jgi:hypothetical protein
MRHTPPYISTLPPRMPSNNTYPHPCFGFSLNASITLDTPLASMKDQERDGRDTGHRPHQEEDAEQERRDGRKHLQPEAVLAALVERVDELDDSGEYEEPTQPDAARCCDSS